MNRTARRTACTVVALVLLVACSNTGNGTSRAGARLLDAATANGRRQSAVSFALDARGRGTAAEWFARRGADSVVRAEYDDGGELEVRRVDGVIYLRTALRLFGAPPAGPWFRIDPGDDLGAWVDLLGIDRLAPTPATVADRLAADVAAVTDLARTGGGRVLTVEPVRAGTGERPSWIRIRRDQPEFAGRTASLYARGRKVAERFYRRVRWGERVATIAAPGGAMNVDGAVDPQAAALADTLLREPATLPDGWTRRATIGITPSQGSGTCQEVATVYAAPAPLTEGYLALYLEPSGCEPLRQAGSADFTAGPNRGWVGRDPATGATVGALTVEGTAVRFRSSLPPANLAGLLATWRPIASG